MPQLKHAVETVIGAMLAGHAVKLGKDTYLMTDDNEVGVEEGENVRIFYDRDLAIGLNEFIKLCAAMPEEELVALRASVALTALNRQKGKRRVP